MFKPQRLHSAVSIKIYKCSFFLGGGGLPVPPVRRLCQCGLFLDLVSAAVSETLSVVPIDFTSAANICDQPVRSADRS